MRSRQAGEPRGVWGSGCAAKVRIVWSLGTTHLQQEGRGGLFHYPCYGQVVQEVEEADDVVVHGGELLGGLVDEGTPADAGDQAGRQHAPRQAGLQLLSQSGEVRAGDAVNLAHELQLRRRGHG
jgi:hypothetical protein